MFISDSSFNYDISKLIQAPQYPIIDVCYEPFSHSARPNLLRNLANGGRVAIFQEGIGEKLFEDFSIVRPSYISGIIRVFAEV